MSCWQQETCVLDLVWTWHTWGMEAPTKEHVHFISLWAFYYFMKVYFNILCRSNLLFIFSSFPSFFEYIPSISFKRLYSLQIPVESIFQIQFHGMRWELKSILFYWDIQVCIWVENGTVSITIQMTLPISMRIISLNMHSLWCLDIVYLVAVSHSAPGNFVIGLKLLYLNPKQ